MGTTGTRQETPEVRERTIPIEEERVGLSLPPTARLELVAFDGLSVEDLTVLYVDGSIGFGGSSKSLALTLRALPEIRKLMITAQEPELVRQLFTDVRTWRFRRHVNYRSRMRLEEWLESHAWDGVGRSVVEALYTGIDVLASGLSLVRIYVLIKRHGVDLVHLNNGYVPQEAILAARLTGTPLVVHFRGFVEPTFRRSWLRWVPAADKTIAVSDASIENLRAVVPDLPTVTIYDPVDLVASRAALGRRASVRKELGFEDRHVVAGIFGRVVDWKGQLEFVQAALAAMERDDRLRGIIVGGISDGSQGYMDRIRAAIERSRFSERFVLTGYRSDVEALYAAIDILVHASISPEPFGMVIPEAMAAGRPVIATDAGGPREIVTPGEDGMLVPMGDVTALRDAMLELSGDPDLRRRMGERARQSARRFAIERNASEVRRVYDDLLGDGHEAGAGPP